MCARHCGPAIYGLRFPSPFFCYWSVHPPDLHSFPTRRSSDLIHHLPQPTPWPRVSFGSWRLWDAYVVWPNVEPQKGQWDFSHLDGYISLAESHSVEILLPLGLTPAWASSRPKEKSGYEPGNAAEPRNISDWSEYVREVATRYKGRIHAYEIWNEPNLSDFFSGRPDTMLELARERS